MHLRRSARLWYRPAQIPDRIVGEDSSVMRTVVEHPVQPSLMLVLSPEET